jgi:tetratricopeptide (TPR) repeat protein
LEKPRDAAEAAAFRLGAWRLSSKWLERAAADDNGMRNNGPLKEGETPAYVRARASALASDDFRILESRMRAIRRVRKAPGAAFSFALLAALPFVALPPTAARAAEAEQGLTLQADPAQRAAERSRLFDALAAATSAEEASTIVEQIWLFWFRAPNAEAGALMSEAMERRKVYDFAGAVAILDKLVALAPDWAEAWNQRATIRFLMEDFDGSLADIEHVLQLEPKHFGALSGEVLILMRFGRFDTAQSVLRKAVEINPFLAERALLVQPPKPAGKDI